MWFPVGACVCDGAILAKRTYILVSSAGVSVGHEVQVGNRTCGVMGFCGVGVVGSWRWGLTGLYEVGWMGREESGFVSS
jgi:hypothetical protein